MEIISSTIIMFLSFIFSILSSIIYIFYMGLWYFPRFLLSYIYYKKTGKEDSLIRNYKRKSNDK